MKDPDISRDPEAWDGPASSQVEPSKEFKKGLSWGKLILLTIMVVCAAATIATVLVITTFPMEFCTESNSESFINGTSIGLEYAVASLTQDAIQCKTIPIEYGDYSYTLIAVECLNLTGVNNG